MVREVISEVGHKVRYANFEFLRDLNAKKKIEKIDIHVLESWDSDQRSYSLLIQDKLGVSYFFDPVEYAINSLDDVAQVVYSLNYMDRPQLIIHKNAYSDELPLSLINRVRLFI